MSGPTPVVSETWARWAVQQLESTLAADERRGTLRHLKDTVAVMCAGIPSDARESVRHFVITEAGDQRVPAASIAFVLGTSAHALDFDSTHFPSMVHPSGVVVATAIAAAPTTVSVETLLGSIAVGHEVSLRLGMAGVAPGSTNPELFERGFHPTPIPATIGAAVTASLLLGLSERLTQQAIGIACSMSAGILEANRVGGTIKAAHSGWAAACGVRAAMLARSGLTAPTTAVEGRFGLIHAFMGLDADMDALIGGLGEQWLLGGLGLKAYPTNGFTHSSIDAAVELRRRGVRPHDVRSARVGVATPSLQTIAEPLAIKRRPESVYAARFSGPIVFARALLGGSALGFGMRDLSAETLADHGLLALADRVDLVGDPGADRLFPRSIACRVEVEMTDGRREDVFIESALGTATNPMSDADLDVKVADCMSAMGQEVVAAALLNELQEMEEGRGGTGLVTGLKTLAMSGDPMSPTDTTDGSQTNQRMHSKG